MSVRTAFSVGCLWALVISMGSLVAAGPRDAIESEQQVALRSVYLVQPVGEARVISLTGRLGGKAKLTLDGNQCTLNEFGDIEASTEKFYPAIDVTLHPIGNEDPLHLGRRLFRLDGQWEPKQLQLILVAPRDSEGVYRLVVKQKSDQQEDETRVITLETMNSERERAAELCEKVDYRAAQHDGKVTITATGEHPTAGWRVVFSELPIEIYPVQHRLVCIPPEGPSAQVITPFQMQVTFTAELPVKAVVVWDADGQHKIPVEQAE
jgi:hypothetical protein